MRLRDIRRDANLSGAALARAANWDRTKVYKIEATTTTPSDTDIRIWCAVCDAEEQTTDLIAMVRAVETMYVEWWRAARSGLKAVQRGAIPLYERTTTFQIYEPGVIPGLFQTREYATARMGRFTEFHGFPGAVADAVQARMEKQRVVRSGKRTFAVVLEESALWLRIGSRELMRQQLDHLARVATWPQVSLGIIPRDQDRRIWSVPNFWIFDGRRVITETPTAELNITTPGEVEIYRRLFVELSAMALVGAGAEHLIAKAYAQS
ncbi:helix-turn-helix transcriptional regulator [Actinomadura sp. NEAU-AAG7]|uniref:helix-turn-helix domain-containing protein n=1 Tax=Actinomadura sp. NEAU-AAG7 TaxID=2839640 RepID=UPI001BE497E2|nr:helix-turn-helix transcriptional regulator [Actinomadura sp. NEAU-AAG7]MBT2207876.1 helix-turn-helix domain-containing protein [Actinomadura sp. NEAU-AAG7]